MINREDMLELTRRMTPARSHIDRIAGAYYDAEGYIDGTFNTHFLKLSTAEKTKNLELAKAVLQAETNKQLKDYRIPETARKPGSIWQLLDGIKESGLQNDAFLDLLYEMIGERVAPGKESYCFLFHGMYDVPVKGTDKEWQEGSEEVYNYLLCAVGQLEGEYQQLLGVPVDMNEVFGKLYNHALEGDADCGGLISYNYISGEPVTGLAEGRPMFVRSANDKFNLANFMRSHLYASVGVLKIGNDILFNEEHVKVDRITGHGGLFKTKGVGQRILAAAINSPISVMETAGEGGAWGIALLGSYLVNSGAHESLADFLENKVFAGNTGVEIAPTAEDVAGFNIYIENYKRGLAIEKVAVENKY